jgi:hypothetical protein
MWFARNAFHFTRFGGWHLWTTFNRIAATTICLHIQTPIQLQLRQHNRITRQVLLVLISETKFCIKDYFWIKNTIKNVFDRSVGFPLPRSASLKSFCDDLSILLSLAMPSYNPDQRLATRTGSTTPRLASKSLSWDPQNNSTLISALNSSFLLINSCNSHLYISNTISSNNSNEFKSLSLRWQ